MKRVIVVISLVLVTLLSGAQSWNPYVCQGSIGKTSLLPAEFNGKGEVSFKIGNTGSSPIVYDKKDPLRNLSLVINFSNGTPNRKNPLASVKGSWVSMFDWTYDDAANSYTAVQKRDIPGYDQGTVTVEFNVTGNTKLAGATNGFKISVKPPAYMKGINTTQDDMVSSYTYTSAYDFGDAPESYGEARHQIELDKDQESGLYTRYIVLGKIVDPDEEARFSPVANGDDVKGNDDEDGVTFPVMTAGSTVTIPVAVTSFDVSYGFLNAWFDWNGDGDFTDPGEKVEGTPLPVFVSGTYQLKVSIPADAYTAHPTFARFRIGENGGPAASNRWGEAEDYQVSVQNSQKAAQNAGMEGNDGKITAESISVYPNPITDEYYVTISKEGSYRLELVNDLGESVFVKQVDMQPGGKGVVQLSRGNLVTGPYILKVTGKDNGISHTEKLLMVEKP
jgi:hypothetical protein